MAGGQISLLFIGAVALLALLLGFWQLGVSRRLSREVSALRRQLDQTVVAPEKKANFSRDLDRVERQQQKRVDAPNSPAEKYQYVASLANQGVDAKGIAAALQMAPAEVEQLLKLARLKRQTQQ